MSRFVTSRPRYAVHKRRLAVTRKKLSFHANSCASKNADPNCETVSESDEESKSTSVGQGTDYYNRVAYFHFSEFNYKLANCKEDNFVSCIIALLV